MIYLASPYSSHSRELRHARFLAAAKAAARLMREGYDVFSPIAHSAPIQEADDMPQGWAYWRRIDEWFLRRCEGVWVLMLPGWQESEGVGAEVELAERFRLPVVLVEPTAEELAIVTDVVRPDPQPVGEADIDG